MEWFLLHVVTRTTDVYALILKSAHLFAILPGQIPAAELGQDSHTQLNADSGNGFT